MPKFGAHQSIAGGYYKAPEAAAALGAGTLQLFTKNNMQWAGKPISAAEAAQFRAAVARAGLGSPTAHASYLINLASPDGVLYRRSLEAFIDEVRRAETLGLDFLVVHPGSPTDGDEEAGIARVARALDETRRRCRKSPVMVLLETTAGQGACLGHRFEHLAAIIERTRDPECLGVCLDTCHVFAAGYPLWPRREYARTFRLLDAVVGLGLLKVFHVNDSARPLGSRVDRHAHIGKGSIGLEAFRLLVNDPRFRDHPMILETPKHGPKGEEMDAVNLKTLRGLARGTEK